MNTVRQLTQRCLLPSAIKPWQKILCASAGLAACTVGVVGGIYITSKINNQIDYEYLNSSKSKLSNYKSQLGSFLKPNPNVYLDKVSSIFGSFIDSMGKGLGSVFSTIDKKINDYPKISLSALSLSTALMTKTFVDITYAFHLEYYNMVRHEVKCCNIIRSTAIYTLFSPMLIAPPVICGIIAVTSLKQIVYPTDKWWW